MSRSRSYPALALIFVLALSAAPPLTVIEDTLYKADGTLFDGIAQVAWKGFEAADGTQVLQNSVTVRIIRGQLRTALVPTTNAHTAALYTVIFNSDGKTQFTQTWAVPAAGSILRLKDVRVQTGPTDTPNPSVYVNLSNVYGLRGELDLRPTRGPDWNADRTAIINSSGALDGARGNPADCVHVDGSSGPCGTGGSGGTGGTVAARYVDAETPSGITDGQNGAFYLSASPSPVRSLRVFRNGILLAPGADYTVSGVVVTFTQSSLPFAGDLLQAWYRISGPEASTVDTETPFGTANGVNAQFTLANPPVPVASLQLFRNGVLQRAGVDFTLAGNTMTFLPASIPTPGDILQAAYRK